MQVREITPQGFAALINEMQHEPLKKVSHPSDGILILEAGKLLNFQYGDEGQEEQYQFSIFIDGEWECWKDNQIVESNRVGTGENRRQFLERIENFVNDFSPRSLVQAKASGDGIMSLIFEPGIRLMIRKARLKTVDYVGWLSFSHYMCSGDGSFSHAEHAGLNENSHRLEHVVAP